MPGPVSQEWSSDSEEAAWVNKANFFDKKEAKVVIYFSRLKQSR